MKNKRSFARIVLAIVLVLACVMSFAACDGVAIKSISVTTLPTKLVYQIGEKFDPTGGKLTAVLADDKMLVVDIDSAMCGTVDTSVAGKVEVKVGYLEKFATFEITVVSGPVVVTEVKSISVTTLPTKVEYALGEAFSVVGGKITVTYIDNSVRVIDIDSAMCGTVDTSVEGKVTVTVTCQTKTATFEITVGKIAPTIATAPTASGTVTYGDALPAITGVAKDGETVVAGVFTLDAGQKLTVANANYNYTFVPTDTAKYATVKGTATITVAPKALEVVWDSAEVVATGSEVAPNATVETGIAGDTITFTVAGNTNAGKYTATAVAVAGANTTLANYTITNLTFDYTIANAFAKDAEQLTAALANAVDGNTIMIAGTLGNSTPEGHTSYDVNKAVAIVGMNGAVVYGTFNAKVDGVTIKDLTINVRGGGSAPLKNGINVIAKTVTITNNTINLTDKNLVESSQGVANGIVIWPFGSEVANYNIANNTINGFDVNTPDWISSGIVVAEVTALTNLGKPNVNSVVMGYSEQQELALASANTYTNCTTNYARQNWSISGDHIFTYVGKELQNTGVVYIPAGTYTLNETLVIAKDNTRLIGIGDVYLQEGATLVGELITVTGKNVTFANITGNQIAPIIATAPTASGTVTYGDALPAINGVAKDGETDVKGVFALDAGQTLTVANATYDYTFTPTDTAKYATVTGTVTINVVAKALTITGVTAQNKSYDGTCDVVLENGTLTGIVSPDVVTLQLGKGTAVNKNAGASVSVTYTPSLLGVDKDNYVISSQNDVSVQVDQKFVKITGVVATERPYDGTHNITISGGVIDGMISGDQLVVELGQGTSDYAECGHDTDNEVSYPNAKLTLADAGNYMINEWTSTKPLAKITKREITAVWPSVTLSYKGKAHDLLYDFNCDNRLTAESGINESISFKDVTCDALLVAAVGTYTFTAHLLSERNFVISVASVTKEYKVEESNLSKAEHYIATVDAIGTVVYTQECLAKIVAAEQEYATLTSPVTTTGNVSQRHSVAVAARLAYDKLAAIAEFNNYKANDYLASDYVTITSKITTHTTNINNCSNIADIPTALSAAKLDLDGVKTNKATTVEEFNKIIASATDGDNVRLGAGNFVVDFDITKSINLVGQGVANTTITGAVVVSGVDKTVSFDGIKFYRETTNTNGIITITSNATVTVTNCSLEHKSATSATAGNNTGVRMEGANSKLYLVNTDINVSHYCVGMRNVGQIVDVKGGVLTAWAAIMTSCGGLNNVATLANNKVIVNDAKLVGRPPVDDDGYGLITLQENLHGNTVELNNCQFDVDLTFHGSSFTGKDYSVFDVRSSNNVITTTGCQMITPFAITVALGVSTNGVTQKELASGVVANSYDINMTLPAGYSASLHVLIDAGTANGADLKYSPVIKINGHNYFVVETSAQLVEAVAKAVAEDTIVLGVGTFADAVTITKPLTIIGQGLDKTIITTCTIDASAIATTLTNVTITNSL